MNLGILALLAFLPLSTLAGNEDEPLNAPEARDRNLEVFNAPKPITLKQPDYPRTLLERGIEGWVNVNFMIDPLGKAYEIVVTDSTGQARFEKSAIRAVKRWEFEPASLDGKAVDAGKNYKLIFELEGARPGARRSFISRYRKFTKAVELGDKGEASQLLTKMKVENLYEDAYFHLARFNYYSRWGTEDEQYSALVKAIAHEKNHKFLPEQTFISALFSIYALEIKSQDFGTALNTANILAKQKLDENRQEKVQQSLEQLLALKTDDQSFSTRGKIGAAYSWFTTLLKKNFQIEVLQGELAEIKLRCQKKYVFFRYQADKSFRIPTNYGDCQMEIVGNPQTLFELTQF